MAIPSVSGSQQYVTDDAALTEYRACLIQLWHGERSSWALPACTPLHDLEVSAGLVAVWKDEGDGHPEYVAQLKSILFRNKGGRFGVGLVVGTGRDPGLSDVRAPGWNVYTYLPATVSFFSERLLVHNNIGYLYDHRTGHENDHQSLTVAVRTDVSLRKYFVVVGEIYDSSDSEAEFQIGARAWTRPGKVQIDLSYGGLLTRWERAAGWTLGLALATPPIL
ncbi:MAG TPA: hypothetical protein VM053_09005 [Gemmatimonadaceae bacterium]|nr:hypothetical protein [Gemmatimonadaceae bacterium]